VPVTGCELLRDRTPVPAAGQDDAEFGFPPAYRPFLDSVPVEEADPGGEQLDVAVSQLAVASRDDRCELLVTHNFVIGWFVRHALDAPWWRWMGLNQFNCALTIVQVLPDTPPMLVSFNDLGHLPVGLRGAPPVPLRS
jgi:probable phosphoglycerate mutase